MRDFQSFIAALGYEPPATIEPGKIIRFSTNGKRGDDAGWALLFHDGDGVVGDWCTGGHRTGLSRDSRPASTSMASLVHV